MHMGPLLLQRKGTNDICIERLNNVVFGKEIANLDNAFPCGSSNVQQSYSGAKK